MSRLLHEDHILRILDDYFPRQGQGVQGISLGRGDDCAVLASGGPRAISCDIFAEGVHFRQSYFSPEHIGHKALAVNLSDLAACGARPSAFLLSLSLSTREDEAWLRGFCRGMSALASRYGVLLAGGDLSRAGSAHISISAWGDLPEGLPLGLCRGQSRLGSMASMPSMAQTVPAQAHVPQPGDVLFVVGALGLARLGLEALEHAAPESALKAWPQACAQHLHPDPLIREGLALARLALDHGLAGRLCLMDVSDGLARDLPRLLDAPRSGLGADLRLTPDLLPDEVLRFCAGRNLDPAAFAWAGGEDYALLGACPAALWPSLRAALPEAWILGLTARGNIVLNGETRREEGFDHFAGGETP